MPPLQMHPGHKLIAEVPIQHIIFYTRKPIIRLCMETGMFCACCEMPACRLALVTAYNNEKSTPVLYTMDGIPMTIDHIDPKSKGGKNSINNYSALCRSCNAMKDNMEVSIDQLKVFAKNKFKRICL